MRWGGAALLALLAGCATPITLPDTFVQLRDAGEGFRAITSDDARVWVRHLYEPTEGDVAFWADTLERDFVEERGYELVAEGEVPRRDGKVGRWLEVTANVDGERVDYLVAVWVDPAWFGGGNWLRVVEFAARRDVYEQRVDAVKAALATVR
ncbi:MAG: hypothetical protein KAI24_25565 [Planctomycetes bacterium]|nr:hypothetical protein [Planctomycetota bacterium]